MTASLRQNVRFFLLLAIAIAAVSGESRAQATSIRACLAGWDLPLKLPYFPQYRFEGCERPPERKASSFFEGPPRSLRMKLSADRRDVSGPRSGEANAATAFAFAHFAAWYESQGFRRGPAVEPSAEREAGHMPSAVYEASRPQGRLQVALTWHGPDLVLDAQWLPTLKPIAGFGLVPKEFRFEEGPHAPLFALPGATTVSEDVLYRDQRRVRLDHHPNLLSAQLFLPEKWLRYRFPKGVAPEEAHAAFREALARAGWIREGAASHFRYALADRSITVESRFHEDDGTQALVILRDPSHQERQASVQAQLDEFREYLFPPARSEDEARFRVAAASQWIRSRVSHPAWSGVPYVEVAPVSADASQSPAGRAAARRVAEELVARGWDAKNVHLKEEAVVPRKPAAGASVRIAFLECHVRTEDRPGGKQSICHCSRPGHVPITWPGACR